MRIIRLLDTHPVMQKLKRVFKLLQDEGIEITIGDYGEVIVSYNDQTFLMYDLEADVRDTYSYIYSFPPSLEYKVILNPEEQD